MAMEHLTRAQVRAQYLEFEKKHIFDQHVDPIDYSLVIPVTREYHYFPRGLKETLSRKARSFFVVKPFMSRINRVLLETEVTGQENLKGLKSAVVTSNHVQMFDCVALKKAMGRHYLNIVAASFNNFKGPLGDGMRASGMLPLPETYEGMAHFEEAVEKCLRGKHYVLFFPEQAEWWYYPKVRPFKDGAFHYAVKFNVPVVPCFISFAPRKKEIKDPEGMYPQRMIVHILKPVYPLLEGTFQERRDWMKNQAFAETKACYEKTYGKPLSYED
jgi:1-acyl-sn-glycerol-3-phosphate acyltransferase